VVARATAKNPNDRYSKASELAAAVQSAAGQPESQIAPEGLQVTRAAAIPVPPATPAPPSTPAPPAAPSPVSHDVFVAGPSEAPPPDVSAPHTPPPPPQTPVEAQGTMPPPGQPPSGAVPTGGLAGGVPPPTPPRAAGGSKRRWPMVAVLALLVGGVAAAVVLATSSSDDGNDNEQAAGERVPATLSPVPTNKVDGLGQTTLRLNGNVATVSLTTSGLLDGQPHAMHIHAGEKGECPTVEAAREHNGHLSISTLDGAAFYGHPRVALTTRGDIGVASILEFSRFPHVGKIKYTRTIKLRPRTARFVRKNLAVIVVHGIDYNGNGSYDATLGGSDLNPALSGEATAPALCGELLAGRAAQQNASRNGVYTASMDLPPGTVNLICHLRATNS
jgi:hypothetical protein